MVQPAPTETVRSAQACSVISLSRAVEITTSARDDRQTILADKSKCFRKFRFAAGNEDKFRWHTRDDIRSNCRLHIFMAHERHEPVPQRGVKRSFPRMRRGVHLRS